MSRSTPLVPLILDLIDRVLPQGRTIARLGADLSNDDVDTFFHETLAAITGDPLTWERDDDCARATSLIDAAYAIGVATGLFLNRAAFGGGR